MMHFALNRQLQFKSLCQILGQRCFYCFQGAFWSLGDGVGIGIEHLGAPATGEAAGAEDVAGDVGAAAAIAD